MGLVLWMPCTKDLHNQGLVGTNPTGTCTYEAGKIGNCAKVTSTIDTGLSSDKWDYSTKSISFGGWFKFNKAEMQAAVLNKSTNTNQRYPSFNLLGKNSYNGFALSLSTNNIYNPTADLTSLNIQAHMRSSTALWSCGFGTIEWDTWIHLFITWDFDSKTFTAYKNGAKVDSYIIPNWGGNFTYRGAFNIAEKTVFGGNGPAVIMPFRVNDVRVYDHCLSIRELKFIASALVLHYPLNDAYVEETSNLGNTSSSYSNMIDGREFAATSWGGDAGTVTYYKSGGYNNLPYKVYHKTASGSGGIYSKTANDISIVAGKTYTMSVWVKASRNFLGSIYSFNINGVTSSDSNHYITYSKNFQFTTEWTRISRTFTATESDAGIYGEMSIIYDNWDTDYYIYFSGFQIEEKDHATPYTPNTRNETTVYDCSGYQNNGTISGSLSCVANSSRYKISTVFDGISSKIINDSFPTSIVSGTNSFTICGWAYYIKGNSYNPLFHIGSAYRDTTGICLHGEGNRIEGLDINGTKINNTYGSGYSNEKWVHQCIVYDGTTIKRYLNGNSTPVQSIACPGFKSDNNKLCVGGFWGVPFKGYLSDFRIYATALSEEDIKELYNTSAYVSDNGALLTYNLEE